jgi:hypothetical protein
MQELILATIAAILEEMSDLTMQATLGDVQLDDALPFNRCARQGAKEAPWQRNLAITYLFHLLNAVWLESGYGLTINEKTYTHMVWADHIYLLASSRETLLKMMIKSLTDMLEDNKLHWKPNSLHYLASMYDRARSVRRRLSYRTLVLPE